MSGEDLIVNKICKCLQDLPREIAALRVACPEWRIGDGAWTKMELSRLYDLAKREGFSACPTFGEEWRDGEWLYDMVWYRDVKGFKEDLNLGISRALENVVLVLESEWSMSPWQVQYDFEKLLVAKALFKVLVVNDIGELAAKRIVESGLENYKGGIANERYVLAMYSGKTDSFMFWCTKVGQKRLVRWPFEE